MDNGLPQLLIYSNIDEFCSLEPLDPPSTGLLLCLSVLFLPFRARTSCVLGVLEVWGGVNDHSEQPDSHFMLSMQTPTSYFKPLWLN